MTAITEAGVYDIPADEYQRDPVRGGSLSSTGARQILDCPARFRYAQDNPRPPKREFDLGQAFHTGVLGSGAETVVIHAKDYRTKAAQADRDAAYEAGLVPLLAHEDEAVKRMVAALWAHPVASALFSPERGESEATVVARDPGTGVWMRARPDKLPFRGKRRMVVPDLKSCASVEPAALSRATWDHGYYIQDPFYLQTLRLAGLCDEQAAFLFVFVEKVPPHLIAIRELDWLAMKVGQMHVGNALTRYAACSAENRWPGYDEDPLAINEIGLPAHIARRYERDAFL